MNDSHETELSQKSYGAAVSLCMIFGIVGVHHFYLGNLVHGILDLGLFIVGFGLIIAGGDPGMMLLGGFLIALDVIHTLVVTILLLVGKVKDAEGRLVAYPGQF